MPASQATVTTSATLLSASRGNKESTVIENNGTTAVYLSDDPAVTTSTGFLLPGVQGAALTVDSANPVYGIVASGTASVSVWEVSR